MTKLPLPSLAGAALLALASAPLARAQKSPVPKPPAAMSAITQADLKRDLYDIASDYFRGREAGTIDELRGAVWEAEQARKVGLVPAGDHGTYFQWWNMKRTRLSPATTIAVGDTKLVLWQDIAASTNVDMQIDAPAVYLADPADTSVDIRGKVVIADVRPPVVARHNEGVNSAEWWYARLALTTEGRPLVRRGAAAVILIADSTAETAFHAVSVIDARGVYDVDDAATQAAGGRYGGAGGGTPVMLARQGVGNALHAAGQTAHIQLITETFDYPSVNVVGTVRGTDPKLRGEYVMFSSHTDHDGVRYPIDGDSIWNGADDNGSTSVAILAIARAFHQQPGKRSALFIWHGAEERGLLGSRYHAVHPVVPLDSIVAVLNGDLIGRNNPDTASLLGVQPPHRNSTALVQMALEANAATGNFVLDSTWDRPTHPEGWYFRSDHIPYVRHGVPALMYSTNLHADYHTPRDEASRIDYAKLKRMTDWMYMTGWLVANAAKRPTVDPGFKLER